MKEFFDHDPLTGLTEYFDYQDGDVTIQTVQDVEPILDSNAQARSDPDEWKQGLKDCAVHYARIPVVVQLQWLQTYGRTNDPMRPENRKLLLKLLASREWGYLRRTTKIHI